MKQQEFKSLEKIYESISLKNKEVISEDANESLGAGIVWIIVFGLPLIFDYFSKKYPDLKEKFESIKNDLKNTNIKEDIKGILSREKQTEQKPKEDGISSLLTGGVRKTPPGSRF